MKKTRKQLDILANEIDAIKNVINSKDGEIKILKEVVLELKKCNEILLRENLQFKESLGYSRFNYN